MIWTLGTPGVWATFWGVGLTDDVEDLPFINLYCRRRGRR
jgi:hypothetical protein